MIQHIMLHFILSSDISSYRIIIVNFYSECSMHLITFYDVSYVMSDIFCGQDPVIVPQKIRGEWFGRRSPTQS